jgi:hypothetical protein
MAAWSTFLFGENGEGGRNGAWSRSMAAWFTFSGAVLSLAALISAYNAAQSSLSSLGLGIAAAGLALGGGLCYLAAAFIPSRIQPPAPTSVGSKGAGPA